MAFEKIIDNFRRLNDNIEAYAKSSAEYYKLEIFGKTMKGITTTTKVVISLFLLTFAVLFISLGLAILISNWLESPSGGFLIVAAIYLLFGLLVLFKGQKLIDRMILSKVSRKVFKEDDEEEERFSSVSSEPYIPENDERVQEFR